jgi:pseudouridine synthase
MPQQPVRLQKLLAESGISSRRSAEDLIRQGRVTVNAKKAVLGQRVLPSDVVELDGARIQTEPNKRYLVLNKPRGVITTSRDPQGRTTVLDFVDAKERLFPVGRLDAETEGLVLLTNDGKLAYRLTHPSFGVDKVYVAEVEGVLDPSTAKLLTSQGVRINSGRPARAEKVRILDIRGRGKRKSVVEITIHEGRKHVVRKMLELTGHPALRLVRTGMGPLKLRNLRPGTYRDLTKAEVNALYRAVEDRSPDPGKEIIGNRLSR